MRMRRAFILSCVAIGLIALGLGLVGSHLHDHESQQHCLLCHAQTAVDLPSVGSLDSGTDEEFAQALPSEPPARSFFEAFPSLTFRGPPA